MIISTLDDLNDAIYSALEDYQEEVNRVRVYCCVCENIISPYLKPFHSMYFAGKGVFKFYCPCCGSAHNIGFKDGVFTYSDSEGEAVAY